jgi:AraC-like DNA-binding protein
MKNEPPPGFIARNVIRGRYLFLDLRPPANVDFVLACAGWEECSPSYEIQRNEFRYTALEYIASGAWELSTPGGKWNIGPGAIFAHGPGISYSLKAVSKRGLAKYFVDFAGTEAPGLLAQAGFKGANPRRIVHGRWLRDILDQLIEAAHMRPAARKRMSQLLTTLLLERIREDTRTRAMQSHALRNYERCRAFLAENYLRVKNLADAARECAVSAPHLSRLFQRFDTESPKDFLLRLKMNHAAELILRNDLSVKETAAQIGFDDVYHFSRCFKRVHGVAPSYFAKGPAQVPPA